MIYTFPPRGLSLITREEGEEGEDAEDGEDGVKRALSHYIIVNSTIAMG